VAASTTVPCSRGLSLTRSSRARPTGVVGPRRKSPRPRPFLWRVTTDWSTRAEIDWPHFGDAVSVSGRRGYPRAFVLLCAVCLVVLDTRVRSFYSSTPYRCGGLGGTERSSLHRFCVGSGQICDTPRQGRPTAATPVVVPISRRLPPAPLFRAALAAWRSQESLLVVFAPTVWRWTTESVSHAQTRRP